MKILYTTDLHGDNHKYEKFLCEANVHGVDAMVVGGDMLPTIGDLFKRQKNFIDDFLDSFFAKVERIRIPFLCYLGNDDLGVYDDFFDKITGKYQFVHNIAQRKVVMEDYEFIGMNFVVDYPFRLKDRCRLDVCGDDIPVQYSKALLSTSVGWKAINKWKEYVSGLPSFAQELEWLPKPMNIKKTAYVIHMPPSSLGLDLCHHGGEVGSRSLLDFIRQNRPFFSLHGHIHESPEMSGVWKTRLNETLCIQPGQSRNGLTYALVDFKTQNANRFSVDV